MEDYVSKYLSFAADLLRRVERESGDAIRQASEVIADALANDKDFLLYGSGHSALIATEATGRAGGLIQAMVIHDIAEGDGERLEGMAALILGRYDLRPGSVIIIISNSGINPVPIEAAQLAKEAGLTVIALTAVAHSKAVPSRHSSGKKLYEIADIVIDTLGVPGDAAIDIPSKLKGLKSGATSTLVGAAIVEAITTQVSVLLIERGIDPPPVIISSNLPEGDAHNTKLAEQYRPRMVRSQMSSHFSPLVTMRKKK
ncbi:MAG: sugar isomerase domain-containing protein [Anaerolineae bacterium]|nr:sugar isomerase domain-containing protein [Anaerolineae bacterium]